MNELIKINSSDSVAVALRALKAGEKIPVSGAGIELEILEDIPMGHKVALKDIKKDESIIKYGFPIGGATSEIQKGYHVHTNNVHTLLTGAHEYEYHPTNPKLEKVNPEKFNGYVRFDGRVGIRNELWIIPTVGCVNDIALAIEKEAEKFIGGSIENVRAFTHPYGCSQMADDQENTRKILANLATHPNAGGVLMLGLGCENSGIETIKPYMGNFDAERVKFLISQDVENEHEAAMKIIHELVEKMKQDKRVPCDTSKLIIGLKCGGSDGLSGITANPTIGYFSDMLTAEGGATILTEVPEMFGAETILMNRARDEETFKKTVDLINNFKAYYASLGMPCYENPSPGNKAGGITTLEDKALGCTQKSGSGPVCDVLPYAGKVVTQGLNLLSAPGNDLVASTALAAAGAQIVLFSTGRGTPFGCPVPTVKISSNSDIAKRKSNWIDFNAGTLVEGRTLPEKARELFDYVLSVANGKKTRNEINKFQGMAIFKTGATL